MRLMDEPVEVFEKKKPDPKHMKDQEEDLPLPSKSEIIRQEIQPAEIKVMSREIPYSKHDPVIEKPSKTFSIKETISEYNKSNGKPDEIQDLPSAEAYLKQKEKFSPEVFEAAWQEFTDQLKAKEQEIISMFKSIRPEVENDQSIKIHLSNAAQKDTFVQNYRQRLINFLEKSSLCQKLIF